MARSGRFRFDGGAATYVGTAILGALVTLCTLGICYPFAMVLRERWRAKHSYIDGYRLVFTGSATGLFGNWLKWLFLSFITLGIYLFWVGPRIAAWKWEHTDFDRSQTPLPLTHLPAPAVMVPGGALPPRIPAQPAYGAPQLDPAQLDPVRPDSTQR
jgi:uncharacterized membrane protein YjgN (DUF898 family)